MTAYKLLTYTSLFSNKTFIQSRQFSCESLKEIESRAKTVINSVNNEKQETAMGRDMKLNR